MGVVGEVFVGMVGVVLVGVGVEVVGDGEVGEEVMFGLVVLLVVGGVGCLGGDVVCGVG